MAPPYRGVGSYQNRRFQSGAYDRVPRGPVPHHEIGPRNGDQASMAYQPELHAMNSNMLPGPRNAERTHQFMYPNGIPPNYKVVKPTDGTIPQKYIEDYLDVSFYLTPAKEVKALFSSKSGSLPTRGLSHVVPTRELHLWSAEEIQGNANAIRKKYWHAMKSMQKPECWEDLYDYFDCFDIYFHGALNLWNLITHLYHENQILIKGLHQSIAFEVGIWCDEWVTKEVNKQKLWSFRNWEHVLSLFNAEDVKELQGMEPVSVELLKSALVHRQAQLHGKNWAQPTKYPANSLGAQWHHHTVQQWLAGQPVPDTPSGMAPPQSLLSLVSSGNPASDSGIGRIPESVSNTGQTSQAPLVVSGTKKQSIAYQPPVARSTLALLNQNEQPQTDVNHAESGHDSSAAGHGDYKPYKAGPGGTQRPSLGSWAPSHSEAPSSTHPSAVTSVPPPAPPPATTPAHHNERQQWRSESARSSTSFDNASQGRQRYRGESKGWEKVQNADESIHGPVFRRSPIKGIRPRAFSRLSSKEDPNCVNQGKVASDKWSYTPCNCTNCEVRERSVYVNLSPTPQLPSENRHRILTRVMSQWGQVEKVVPLPFVNKTDCMGCIVRYTDESRIREVVATNDFDCEELQSRVRIGAMHHSKYGNAIYHSRTSPAKSNSWQRGTSTVRHHRDARIQVSLEQFMLQKPQTVKPPAEAESQSKPPSEEALPDSEPFDEGNSPPGVTNLGNNGKGKAIRVHLPATPKKEKHSSSQVIKKPTMGQENAAIAFKKSELLALAAPSETPLESCDCEDTGTSKTVRTSKSQEKALVNTSSEKSKVGKGLPSPPRGRGYYSKVFTPENPEQVDIFDLQPVQSTKSAKEAGHALDTLLDASIGLQSLKSDQQHVQPATDPESLSEKKYKGKGKSNKKKKKTAVVSEPPEATGSQNFDNHTTEGTAEEQGSQTQVVFILSRGRSMRVLEPENPQNPSPKNLTEYLGNGLKPSEANEPAETTSLDYRANAGGSLRMSKIRKKPLLELKLAGSSASDVDATLPSDTALASAASFVTAKEHSSCDGSQGMASTPATPFSGKETMPTAFTLEPRAADHVEASNTTILLNPQAKEFPSSGPSTMPLSSVKLAPIPLKRPMQHQRNVSDTSIATSRTITPDISPTKPDTDNAKKSVQGVTKRDTAIIPTDSNASTTPVSHDDKLTPENDDDDGLWQLQRNQRTLTKGKSKQPNGRMQSQQHHSYAKQGNSKNHHSPKKQKTQGKNHLLPRYVSSPNNRTASTSNKEDFPSVQAGRASDSVLPAASTWGKVRPASTATGATAISAKGHTTGGQVSNEEVDKQ